MEAYKYGRQIEHHPINDPLLEWLSHALEQTSKFFIPGSTTPIQKFLESDSLYYLWFPVNTIFHNSDIQALGQVHGFILAGQKPSNNINNFFFIFFKEKRKLLLCMHIF